MRRKFSNAYGKNLPMLTVTNLRCRAILRAFENDQADFGMHAEAYWYSGDAYSA